MSSSAPHVVLEAIKSRMTIGRLSAPAPSDADLQLILQAGARAPDHGKLKPWRFHIVRGAALARLGELMATALAQRVPGSDALQLDRERQKPTRTPMIVVVSAVMQGERIPAVEQLLAAGAAAQNILLAAHALGYGAAWKTGDAVYDDHVKAAFGLRPIDAIVGFIYIGTPDAPQAFAGTVDVAPQVSEWTGPV